MIRFIRQKIPITLLLVICLMTIVSGQTITNHTNLSLDSGLVVTVMGDVHNEGNATINNQGLLDIKGAISNNSSAPLAIGNGTVTLSGSNPQIIDGSAISRFFNLRLNNAAGLTLNQSIIVEGRLNMANGKLDLNGQHIDLQSSGSITGETGSNRIFGSSGFISTTRDLGIPAGNNIAGMGVAISTASNLGMTQIVRAHNSLAVGTGNSIERSFDIQPANNTNLAATLRIDYFNEELNGQNSSTLTQWRMSPGASNWTPGVVSNTGTGFVEGGPYDFMALWTLSADGTSAIEDLLPELSINIFPNPLSGNQLHIEGLAPGEYQLRLLDARGKQIWSTDTRILSQGSIYQITLPELTTGVYLIHIQSNEYSPSTHIISISR